MKHPRFLLHLCLIATTVFFIVALGEAAEEEEPPRRCAMAEISEEDRAALVEEVKEELQVDELLKEIERLKERDFARQRAEESKQQQIQEYRSKWEEPPTEDEQL